MTPPRRALVRLLTGSVALLVITCSGDRPVLPETIAGLRLQEHLTGDAARRFVDRLHGRSVTPEDNEIGVYAGQAGRATVYVTRYADARQAESAGRRMTDRISPANSAFSGGEYLDVGGRQVYRCTGMGQIHFVLTDRQRLYWVSAGGQLANAFLAAWLDYLE